MYCTTDANDRSTYEAWLLQHEVDELIITQFVPFHAQLLEARASEIEHLRSWSPPKQFLYLTTTKRIFKEISFVDFYVLLRKILLRLTTGISFCPAIEVHLDSHLSILLSS